MVHFAFEASIAFMLRNTVHPWFKPMTSMERSKLRCMLLTVQSVTYTGTS
jgi:hypothetical protein